MGVPEQTGINRPAITPPGTAEAMVDSAVRQVIALAQNRPMRNETAMPTYVCWAARGRLAAEDKKLIARGITTIHSQCTGAPPAFVQTIFTDIDADSHYIGGEDASESVWVYGHIREHRDAEVRTAILQRISQLLVDLVGIDPTLTWTYINPLANTDMVEFGYTLPLPGQEDQWIHEKPAPLRDRLLKLNELAAR